MRVRVDRAHDDRRNYGQRRSLATGWVVSDRQDCIVLDHAFKFVQMWASGTSLHSGSPRCQRPMLANSAC
ncbi:MAG: hypothetical protein ABIQ29_07930, partial [Burkholderiaceae bacterium]